MPLVPRATASGFHEGLARCRTLIVRTRSRPSYGLCHYTQLRVGNTTSQDLKHAGYRDARATLDRPCTRHESLSTSGRARSCEPRTVGGGGSPGTPLRASRRSFGNRLLVLHVYNATVYIYVFFSEHAHRFGSHERRRRGGGEGKKHTHEHRRTFAAHAHAFSVPQCSSALAEREPMQCGGGDSGGGRDDGLQKALFFRRGMHPLAEHCTPSLFNRVQRLGLRHKVQ